MIETITLTPVSKYYPGYDGCKLVVDLYFPQLSEVAKNPAILYTGYINRRDAFEMNKKATERFVQEGYVVVIVEPRGVGASYGFNDGFWNRNDAKDMKNIIDTIAKEDWCNGNIGMFGGSNFGMIQLLTASEVPEHLKAIIPNDNSADFYYQNYTNGASALPDMPRHHAAEPKIGTPVDDDPAPDFPMATEALKLHEKNGSFLGQYMKNMRRDTINPMLGYAPNMVIPAWESLDNVKYSGIKIYYNAAWYDPGCTGAIIEYKYWGGKLLLGPWRHCEMYSGVSDLPNGAYDWISDHVRFFDATLKGLNNSVFVEPPVLYYTKNANPGEEWRRAADLPLDSQALTDLYFSGRKSGTSSGVNDGSLTETSVEEVRIDYAVDNDIELYTGFGKLNRRIERNMSSMDEKCITFTSEIYNHNLELTGIPSLDIWVTSTYEDGNFIAVLEEITPDGYSHFITDGAMRASHGWITPNSAWDSLGLPYHSGLEKDVIKMSTDKPLNLSFNLEATSYIIRAGSRIRVSIMCGEKNVYQQPIGFPEKMPVVSLYTGGETASLVRLPIIKADVSAFTGQLTVKEDGEKYEGPGKVYAFKRGVYLHYNNLWKFFKNKQVYNSKDATVYVNDAFKAEKVAVGQHMQLAIKSDDIEFIGKCTLPDLMHLFEESTEIKKYIPSFMKKFNLKKINPTYKNIYVATVPVEPGRKNLPNTQPVTTMDLFLDILHPEKEAESYPCIINIHGYGGNHHHFELIVEDFLALGYAVASIDYRTYPPNFWPAPIHDVNAAIRHLKANAKKYKLNPDRFGVIGGSAGGHLSAMVAASNGAPELEGDIGGNTEYTSSVKAAAIYFPWTDMFSFGEDIRSLYPGQPERVSLCDGPYAPLGCIIGYEGPGKGFGELKKHLYDKNPYYKELLAKAVDASPISHVTENSAPSVFVHGIFECGIQIPMGQSVHMFEALTRKGVKSLLLCNNNGIYGDDPEVKQAVVDFMKNRV